MSLESQKCDRQADESVAIHHEIRETTESLIPGTKQAQCRRRQSRTSRSLTKPAMTAEFLTVSRWRPGKEAGTVSTHFTEAADTGSPAPGRFLRAAWNDVKDEGGRNRAALFRSCPSRARRARRLILLTPPTR